MLPKELETIFEVYAEDDYYLVVTRAENTSKGIQIDFELNVQNINDKGEIVQVWRIEALGHRKDNVAFSFTSFIEVKDDHPLLWKFTDTQCELYFNGQFEEPAKLFYDLYVTHERLFGIHQCFNTTISAATSFYQLFQFTNGLLAKGSKKLMVEYAKCLEKSGLSYTIIGERQPKYWDGNEYIPESKDLKIFFLGGTYIIAEHFSFVRLDNNSR